MTRLRGRLTCSVLGTILLVVCGCTTGSGPTDTSSQGPTNVSGSSSNAPASGSSTPSKGSTVFGKSDGTPPPTQQSSLRPDGVGAPTDGLTSTGSLTVTDAGSTIENKKIDGCVEINAPDVTVRDSVITCDGYFGVKVADGVSGTVIENVTMNGTGPDGAEGSIGILGTAKVNLCDIFGFENGVVPSDGSVITNSYLHDLDAPGDPHVDGIQMDGKISGVRIESNVIDVSNEGTTSAVMMDNEFGPLSDIEVKNNVLLGGTYTVYVDGKFTDQPLDVVVTGNKIGSGLYGAIMIRNSSPKVSDNVDQATGQVLQKD